MIDWLIDWFLALPPAFVCFVIDESLDVLIITRVHNIFVKMDKLLDCFMHMPKCHALRHAWWEMNHCRILGTNWLSRQVRKSQGSNSISFMSSYQPMPIAMDDSALTGNTTYDKILVRALFGEMHRETLWRN